ncbi:MAG: hypothetical protein MJ162_02575 [Treponema sp.]|nr:hypothetical protein [Treponema sp.]
MRKFKIFVFLFVTVFLVGCSHGDDNSLGGGKPSSGIRKPSKDYAHGLEKDKTLFVNIDGNPCIVELNARTGECIITQSASDYSRSTDDENADTPPRIEAEFEFFNGRLSLKAKKNIEKILKHRQSSGKNPLYITFTVSDIESESPEAEDDSVKLCNDSDTDKEESNADARIDYVTEAFINKLLFDPYTLPEPEGKNYFAGRKIYTCNGELNESRKDNHGEFGFVVDKTTFSDNDYSYKIIKDNGPYIIGLLYFKHRFYDDTDIVIDACSSIENFKNWLDGNIYRFEGLKIDSALGTYGSVQKYLRAYYGLSETCAEDEVVTVYLRNYLESVNRNQHVEMQAFWIEKATGDMNMIMTTEPGLTYREQYEINNPWPLLNTDMNCHILPGGQTVNFNGTNMNGLSGCYNIIEVTEDTITFVDTNGDWPVRYNILYTEMEYKPEWTGYFTPNGEGWQNEIYQGVKSNMMCEAIWGDTNYHTCASGSRLTQCFYIDLANDYGTTEPVPETPADESEVETDDEPEINLPSEGSDRLTVERSFNNDFYRFNTQDFSNNPDAEIFFELKNVSEVPGSYRIHIAWVDDKELEIDSLEPGVSKSFIYKISDLLDFSAGYEYADKPGLEVFCDSNIIVVKAGIVLNN